MPTNRDYHKITAHDYPDSLHFLPMPTYRTINKNRSYAVLTPRLLQVGCNKDPNYSLCVLELINHPICWWDWPSFETRHHWWRCHPVTLAMRETILSRPHTSTGRDSKESIFLWHSDPRTPLPHSTPRAWPKCGNPSPHKNWFFQCQ